MLYGESLGGPYAAYVAKERKDAHAVMHGTRDQVIPYALGKQLFDDLHVPKEMLTANAGHSEIPVLEAGRYYEAVIKFAR